MVDLPLCKGQRTLSNQKSKSRIDRFFISSCFLFDLMGVSQKILPQPTSDHYPICIEADGTQWGPMPFRLDNKWLKNENFRHLVENTWKNCVIRGCASDRFVHKLKALKNAVKKFGQGGEGAN